MTATAMETWTAVESKSPVASVGDATLLLYMYRPVIKAKD